MTTFFRVFYERSPISATPIAVIKYLQNFSFFSIVQLATRVAFHDHLLPVCLPPTDMKELVAGTNCTVIGWGKKEDKNCEFVWKKKVFSAFSLCV